MKKILIICLILVALLVGCVSNDYVPPFEGCLRDCDFDFDLIDKLDAEAFGEDNMSYTREDCYQDCTVN